MRALIYAALAACFFLISAGAQTPLDTTKTITLLYTNDLHAQVEPVTATWLVDQPKLGGFRALSAWIAMMRREEPNAFLFDSGDLYEGPAISTLTRGQALIEMAAVMGYDATLYGNHEFDYGMEAADAYQKGEPFPVLAANLFYKDGRPYAKPYAIVEHGGVKVAVIGIFGPTAVAATLQSTFDVLEVRDPVQVLKKLVPELRKQADLIVVLTHEGVPGPMQTDAEAHPDAQRDFNADKELIEAVPGVDVLIGGHPHRGIEVPWVSPKTGGIVVQTYGHGTTLGVLQVKVDGRTHKVVGEHGSLLRVAEDVFPVPPAVDRVVTAWEKKADALGGMVVGSSTEAMVRNYWGESGIGDVICDSLLAKSGAEIAFENAGGIRDDLPAGQLRRYDLISVVPFYNTVFTMKLTGAQVREAIEEGLSFHAGVVQVAGVQVKADAARAEGHRALSIMVQGKPLEDARVYSVAATSFIANGGDHYDVFLKGADRKDTGVLLSDALESYVKMKNTISPPPADRMTIAHIEARATEAK